MAFLLLFVVIFLVFPYGEYESCGGITDLGSCYHLWEQINLFKYFFGDLPDGIGSPEFGDILQISLNSFLISLAISSLSLISSSVRRNWSENLMQLSIKKRGKRVYDQQGAVEFILKKLESENTSKKLINDVLDFYYEYIDRSREDRADFEKIAGLYKSSKKDLGGVELTQKILELNEDFVSVLQ